MRSHAAPRPTEIFSVGCARRAGGFVGRMVLSEGVLDLRRREYELERQASLHDLGSSRGQLAYLSTLSAEG